MSLWSPSYKYILNLGNIKTSTLNESLSINSASLLPLYLLKLSKNSF